MNIKQNKTVHVTPISALRYAASVRTAEHANDRYLVGICYAPVLERALPLAVRTNRFRSTRQRLNAAPVLACSILPLLLHVFAHRQCWWLTPTHTTNKSNTATPATLLYYCCASCHKKHLGFMFSSRSPNGRTTACGALSIHICQRVSVCMTYQTRYAGNEMFGSQRGLQIIFIFLFTFMLPHLLGR